jgi:hypothetical protein
MSVSPRLLAHQAPDATAAALGRYRSPQYEPVAGEVWHHVLYGHVPKHQMDFILRPVVPYHRLRPQHLAHLGALIKFLAPAADESYSFSIGNLSCDDTQHLPGRGGLALMLGTRIAGLRDHALRDSPVFAHAIVCIDQRLDPELLHAVAVRFKERVLREGLGWYNSYYGIGQPDAGERTLAYIRSFTDLPDPDSESEAPVWFHETPPPYNLIYIQCGAADFSQIAWCAARLAAILYRTGLRWTSISTGTEPVLRKTFDGDEYGVAVRLLRGARMPPGAAHEDPGVEPGASLRVLAIELSALELSDEALAQQLFGLPAPRPDSTPTQVMLPGEWPAAANSSQPPLPPPAFEPPTELGAANLQAERPSLLLPLPAPPAVPSEPPGSEAAPAEPPWLAPQVQAPPPAYGVGALLASGLAGVLLGAGAVGLVALRPGVPSRRPPSTASTAHVRAASSAGAPDERPANPSAAAGTNAGSSSARRTPEPPAAAEPDALLDAVVQQGELTQRELQRIDYQLRHVSPRQSRLLNDERIFKIVDLGLDQMQQFKHQRDQRADDQQTQRLFGPLCEATVLLRTARRLMGQGDGGRSKPAARGEPRADSPPPVRTATPHAKDGLPEQPPTTARPTTPAAPPRGEM